MDGERVKILLVEDESAVRGLYQEVLEQSGFEVEVAGDGKGAYEKMIKGGFSLILLDIKMPGLDGLQVLEKYKSVADRVKNGPIVMLTNLGDEVLVKKAIGLGALSYMDKSYLDPKQLVDKVKGVLGLPEKKES